MSLTLVGSRDGWIDWFGSSVDVGARYVVARDRACKLESLILYPVTNKRETHFASRVTVYTAPIDYDVIFSAYLGYNGRGHILTKLKHKWRKGIELYARNCKRESWFSGEWFGDDDAYRY